MSLSGCHTVDWWLLLRSGSFFHWRWLTGPVGFCRWESRVRRWLLVRPTAMLRPTVGDKVAHPIGSSVTTTQTAENRPSDVADAVSSSAAAAQNPVAVFFENVEFSTRLAVRRCRSVHAWFEPDAFQRPGRQCHRRSSYVTATVSMRRVSPLEEK